MRNYRNVACLLLVLTLHALAQNRSATGGTGAWGGVAGLQTANARMVITTKSLADATSGVAYTQTLTQVNGVTPLSWTVLLGNLPPGMTLNSSTGVISGTSNTPGNYTFTIFLVDSTSPTAKTATQDLSIAVGCPTLQILSTSPLPPAKLSTAYSYQFLSQGGLGTVTWAVTSGALPTGVTLSSAGLLSGTPTVSGSVSVNITATDACPLAAQSTTNAFTFTVNSPVVINTVSPLPAGTTGSAYSTQFTASGGTAPFTWSRTSGTLPPGLALASNGVLNGTPTTSGTFTFTIQAQDSLGTTNSVIFTLTVSCGTLAITTSMLPPGTQNAPYSQTLAYSGGSGAVTWLLTTGSWPNGITLTSAGLISGTPTQAGSFTETVQATDSCSTPQVTTQDLTLTINSGLAITTATALPDATQGTAYTTTMSATGGVPPYSWTTPAGLVPNGAIDIMDYAVMSLTNRNNFHLSQTGLAKYFRVDAGLIWWIKNSSGNPWDGEGYDADHVYQWFTEGPTWGNASGYKKYRTPVPLWPRYFVPGSDIVTYTPGPNLYDITESCGTDNLAAIDNLGIRGELQGPFSGTFGGDIGTVQYLLASKWIKCSTNSPTSCTNREQYWLGAGIGQFQWQASHLSGGSFVIDQTSLTNLKVAGGASTPNFACGVPTVPFTGTLPAGVTSTAAPQLNLNSTTGVISGTPAVSGTSAMTIQVEDSVGTIAQGSFTLNVTCPTLSITSTSPLPKATNGQAYSFQLSATGGVLPIKWTTSGPLPAGLTLSAAGLIAGTPTATGVFLFAVQAKDTCAPTAQVQIKNVSLSVAANTGSLAISTTSPLQPATEGTAYSQQMAATGGTSPYTWAVTAGSLPAGLTLSSAGVISGTPTTTGTTTPTIRVTDALSATASTAFSITVSCPALTMISTTPLPTGTQNTAYSYQFQASGGITPYTWTLTAGSFPTGLSMTSAGALTGTPTGSGTSTPTVRVADACSATPQTQPLAASLTINAAVVSIAISTTSPLPAGVVGTVYSTSMSATGGTQPYFWSVTSGAMPGGLTLNANGTITGTPTTSGTFTPTIQVTDSLGASTSSVFSITISCTTLVLSSSTTLPQGTNGSPYSFQFTSTGGVSPFTWSKTSGTFPSGLSLSSGGLLSGTPGASGTFSPVIQVADTCSTPQTASNTFTLVVQPATVALAIVTTSPLPSGTQSVAYSSTMTATGGTSPYTWAVTSGTLPTGLSLSAVGVISGTPSGTGTSTVTIRVTDNVAATASGTFTITINAATAADNRYCNPNETWIGSTTDGPASLPNKCVRTALTDTPATVATKTVCTSGCDFTTIQAAMNAAVCGWTIQIKSTSTGTATGTQNSYSGAITIPATSCPTSNWIIVENDQVSSLPAEGSRITPGWIGKQSLPGRPSFTQPSSPGIYLPQLINSGTVMTFTAGASHWRFIGLEFTTTATSNQVGLIAITGVNHIIFDRIVCHGGNSSLWQSTNNTTRCFSANGSTYIAFIDSYMGDVHSGGNDNQPVYLGGTLTTATGPIKLVNNFLEGAGMCFFSGGGGAGLATLPSTDSEIRRNHCFRPLFWKTNDPTYFGTQFWVKNNGEFKNTQRALLEGNVFENMWGQQADQFGAHLNFGPKNQSSFVSVTASSNGTGTLTRVSGPMFPSNVTGATCATAGHCNVTYNGVTYQAQAWIDGSHITVAPAPPVSGNAAAKTCSPGLNPSAIVSDITVRYNRFSHSSRGIAMGAAASDCGDVGLSSSNYSIHDNILDDINGSTWNLSGGACCFWSSPFQLQNFNPAPSHLHDISIIHNTAIAFQTSSGTGGAGPDFMFGTKGTKPNPGLGLLNIRDNISTGGVVQTGSALSVLGTWAPAQFCFQGNVLTSTTATTSSNTYAANNAPYPAAGQSPLCATGIGNFNPASFNAIQFTNLNGGIGGNYLLLPGSPYHNAASDGTDPGANVPAVNQATAGVP